MGDTEAAEARVLLKNFQKKKSSYWIKKKQDAALSLATAMIERVPAYKEYVRSKGFSKSKVETWEEFQQLPLLSKKDYLTKYPLKQVFDQKSLGGLSVFTATSGTTGDPYYFARTPRVEFHSSIVHEWYLKRALKDRKGPTLAVVCFGMGVWIGGTITYQALELAGKRGTPVSIITPGINKAEIMKILRILGPQFETVVLIGYAPFLKDVVDDAADSGIAFKPGQLRYLFAAEVVNEGLRNYLLDASKETKDRLSATMNIYGSADLGTMAFETPLSVMMRAIALDHPALYKELFTGATKLPTFAQYIPDFVCFEETEEGELLVSADSAIPLVRYQIGDHGGEFSFAHAEKIFKKYGIDLRARAEECGIGDSVAELPFVYVYERIDLSVTLYGLQVFPETIREVLYLPQFSEKCSGKFTLETCFDSKHEQYLAVRIEMRKKRTAVTSFKKALLKSMVDHLRAVSSEYNELSKYLGERAEPRITFFEAEDPRYFKPGVKQSWVAKKQIVKSK